MTSDEEIFDQLARLVLVEKEIVTYKGLSQKMSVSNKKSKEMLGKFVEKEHAQLDTLYVVVGTEADNNIVVKTVRQADLEEQKRQFAVVTGYHVLSVAPKLPSGELDEMADAISKVYEKNWNFYKNLKIKNGNGNHPWSSVVPVTVKLCNPSISTSSRNIQPPPAGYRSREAAAGPPAAKVFGNKRPNSKPVAGQHPAKKAKTGSIHSMFSKKPSASTQGLKTAPTEVPKKKKNGGIMGFFGKSNKKGGSSNNPFNRGNAGGRNPTSGAGSRKRKMVFGSGRKAAAGRKSRVVSVSAPVSAPSSVRKKTKLKNFSSAKRAAPKSKIGTVAKTKTAAAALDKKKGGEASIPFADESESEDDNCGGMDEDYEEEYMLKEKRRIEKRREKRKHKALEESDEENQGRQLPKKAKKSKGDQPKQKMVKKVRHYVDPDTGMMVTEDCLVPADPIKSG